MATYIDAGKLKVYFVKQFAGTSGCERLIFEGIYSTIDNFPAADVAEVKHGEWEKQRNKRTCSVCGFIYCTNIGDDNFNYCPDCGAKMDGKE